MHNAYSAFLKRLEIGFGRGETVEQIAQWLVDNTTLNDVQFGFDRHEFQIDIANDISRRLVVKKCSQVGLTELLSRKILAYLNIARNVHAIYTMPSSKDAQKLSKTRFDPIIKGSKLMSENVNPNVNSTEIKQFGSNFLYLSGTYGQSAAISVPATMVVRDEVNFSDPVVLTTYASRLRHAEDGGYLWDFSTPTVEGYGVSESYDRSDKHLYLCKCKCGYEDAPDFNRDMVVPGLELDMAKFSKIDLLDPSGDFTKAVMLCPQCRNPWPLGDASRRRWVAQKSLVLDMRGYWVRPWDVPYYNSAPVILSQAANYETHQDWNNFVLGADYSDSENSFVRDKIMANQTSDWLRPEDCTPGYTGFVGGMDVGKTSWFIVGRRVRGELQVVYLERIAISGDGTNISNRAIELAKTFSLVRLIVDAAPDFTTALRVVEGLPVGVAYACYYTKTDQRKLSNISEKDGRVIHVNRTKALNQLAKNNNEGRIKYPRHSETKLLVDHLCNLKRVDQKQGVEGEVKSFWVSTGPDHYGHSLNYCNVASQTIAEQVGLPQVTALPTFRKVNTGAGNEVRHGDHNLLVSEKVRRKIFNGRL